MAALRWVRGRMLLKQYSKCTRITVHPTQCCRPLSTTPDDLVQMQVNSQTGVATIRMNKKPVNSLNFEMLTQLSIAFEKVKNDKSIGGVILTSNVPGIFSAGLDIMEFFNSKERLGEFWRVFQEVWIRLYGLNTPVIAAINGHAPAGGCLLSLASDYRIMAAGKYTIGLNETQLGIVAPWWFMENAVRTVGHGVAERACQLGHMFDTKSALSVGLVDEVVEEGLVYPAAEKELARWQMTPAVPRIITKQYFRKPLIDKLQAGRQDDINNFVDYMTRDSVQKMLQEYVEKLKKK